MTNQRIFSLIRVLIPTLIFLYSGLSLATPVSEQQDRLINTTPSKKNPITPPAEFLPKGRCPDDLLGTFSTVPNLSTQQLSGLIYEFIHPDYKPGQPAFTITGKGEHYISTGAISGHITPISFEHNTHPDSMAITCTVQFGDDMKLISVNASVFGDETDVEFRKYLGKLWGYTPSIRDIHNIHYYMVYLYKMTGVISLEFYIPMQRISTF